MALFPEVKLAGRILGDMISLMMFVASSSSLQESRLNLKGSSYSVVIMVREPDGRILSKTIIETFEEISFAKDTRIIGNHNSCFAEGSATASDWVFFFIKFF